MYVEYSSNNSGGQWWLKDDDWKNLEKSGWIVKWKGQRFLGCLASSARKENVSSLREAVDEWEKITGNCATDAGCPCCGQPHYFELCEDDGKSVESGPNAEYSCSFDD